MMKCQVCFVENPENAKFCMGCGQALRSHVTEASDMPLNEETTTEENDTEIVDGGYEEEYYYEEEPARFGGFISLLIKTAQGIMGFVIIICVCWSFGSYGVNYYVTKVLPEKMYQNAEFWDTVNAALDKDIDIEETGAQCTVYKEPMFESNWVDSVKKIRPNSVMFNMINNELPMSQRLHSSNRLYYYTMTIPIEFNLEYSYGEIYHYAFISVYAVIDRKSDGLVFWEVTDITYDNFPGDPIKYQGMFYF